MSEEKWFDRDSEFVKASCDLDSVSTGITVKHPSWHHQRDFKFHSIFINAEHVRLLFDAYVKNKKELRDMRQTIEKLSDLAKLCTKEALKCPE